MILKRFTNGIIHVTGESMAVILLSIKPEYAEKIFAGTKNMNTEDILLPKSRKNHCLFDCSGQASNREKWMLMAYCR